MGTVIITKSKRRTSYTEFSLFTLCRPTFAINENQHVTVATRETYRQRFTIRKLSFHFIEGTVNSNFRRSIKVSITAVGEVLTPVIKVLIWHYFTSKEHILHVYRLFCFENIEIGYIDEHKRNPKHERNFLLIEIVNQLGRECEITFWNNIKRRTSGIHKVNIKC